MKNEAAFPGKGVFGVKVSGEKDVWGKQLYTMQCGESIGLTKRELFALAAQNGLLALGHSVQDSIPRALEAADLMITALSAGEK